MRSRRVRTSATAFVVAALLSTAKGSDAATPRPTKVDPTIARAIAIGFVSPWDAHARGLHPGTANVVVELSSPANATSLAALEKAGAKLTRLDGAPLFYDRFVPATLDARALATVGVMSMVKHLSLAPAPGPMALDHSAQIIGLDGARGANRPADEITGQGMVIADADTDVDVFHPKFFRADGGWFDWIDVDGDGALTPDVDAVDLDHDGKAGAGETAHGLKAPTLDLSGRPVAARSTSFDPAIDWVYLDTNGNGARDVGPTNGFDDTTPAFGEPLFTPDDVNRDGKITIEERVVRLGTSKFAAAYVDLVPPYVTKTVHHTYQRGTDLSQLLPAYTDQAVYGYADALHATGVMSILVGDVPLVGRRWVGMAPDADVLLAWSIDSSLAHVTWALGKKPDAMFHETAPWTGQPLDGSDAYSKMIDTSVTTNHVTHTCPTGDIGGSGKHAHLQLSAGATQTVPFFAPAGGKYTYVDVSLNVRNVPASSTAAPPNVGVSLVEPDGTKHDLGITAGTLDGGASFYPTSSTTDRGTSFLDVVVYTTDTAGAPIPTGNWSVEVTGDATLDATIDAYVSDDLSGFGRGWAWKAPYVIEASTLAYPSTADHCIAIGAEPAHAKTEGSWFDGNEPVDSVRDYSPRGPRIDGMIKPDVLAPDNPWSAAPNVILYPGQKTPAPVAAEWPFGGTSGSVPHAAGVTALMAQIGIRGDAAGDALRKSARIDGISEPLPNADWGYGRMNAAAAMGGTFDGKRPSIALQITPSAPVVGDAITVTPVASSDDGADVAIEARWDDGYDGSWDTAYAALGAHSIAALASRGVVRVKVRARNAGGRIAEAVALVQVKDAPPVEPPSDDAGTTNSDGGGGSSSGCGCETAGKTGGLAIGALVAAACATIIARRRRRA